MRSLWWEPDPENKSNLFRSLRCFSPCVQAANFAKMSLRLGTISVKKSTATLLINHDGPFAAFCQMDVFYPLEKKTEVAVH